MDPLKRKIILKKNNFIQKKIYLEKCIIEADSLSIDDLIEKNDKFVRDEIIEILNKISNSNKDLLKGVKIYENFNFWSLTNFEEKNLYKKNNFYLIAKIISLWSFLKDQEFDSIEIFDSNINLTKFLKRKFPNKKIIFKKIPDKEIFLKKSVFFFNEIYSLFISFIFICKKIFSKKITNFKIKEDKNLFLSFFSYLDDENLKQNIYKSFFWGDLSLITNSNFLHFFLKSKKFPDIKKTQNTISGFKDNNTHNLLDNFCSFNVIKKILVFSIKIKFKSFNIKKKLKIDYENSDLSDFLNEDIKREFLSFNILIKLYFFFTLENFFNKFKFKKNCFFITENQPWEKSLIYHWRRNNDNEIYGVINSLVRFWDLRYSKNKYHPNKILVNGDFSYINLKNFGYNNDELESVESLRYENPFKLNEKNTSKNILVLFDYSRSSNDQMIQILNSVKLLNNFKIFVKFHTLGKIKKDLIKIDYQNYSDDVQNFQFVICSNKTSASVDFYRKGCKIMIIKDVNEFNLSPLKDFKDCAFVGSADEIDHYLNSNDKFKGLEHKYDKFYLINKELSNWKKFLND